MPKRLLLSTSHECRHLLRRWRELSVDGDERVRTMCKWNLRTEPRRFAVHVVSSWSVLSARVVNSFWLSSWLLLSNAAHVDTTAMPCRLLLRPMELNRPRPRMSSRYILPDWIDCTNAL